MYCFNMVISSLSFFFEDSFGSGDIVFPLSFFGAGRGLGASVRMVGGAFRPELI